MTKINDEHIENNWQCRETDGAYYDKRDPLMLSVNAFRHPGGKSLPPWFLERNDWSFANSWRPNPPERDLLVLKDKFKQGCVNIGDWVICDHENQLFWCKHEEFTANYVCLLLKRDYKLLVSDRRRLSDTNIWKERS